MARMLFVALLFVTISMQAQTNVRAWYANGQVWVVWNIQLPLSETVGVYASENSFSNTNDAPLIGRPFLLDFVPTALKEQVDTSLTYRIPDGQGGIYQLGDTEGLFVYTPHEEGSMYFAVVRWGENTITAGSNITDAAIPFFYDPINDPIMCHRQSTFISPFNLSYVCQAFYMWVDGRDDLSDSRPDFPVMANAAKNGMPGFFLISARLNIDTSQSVPLSVWLHGGGGTARQSLAGSRREVNIDPQEGLLLSHNDDVFGRRGSAIPYIENPSFHFGWRKNWDPFTSDNLPLAPDTIINYTQRRYIWIDEWMIRNFNVDPKRIHIHGHSMGSWGTTGLVKAYPDHYASAVIFNNGFRGHDPGTNVAAMFGEPSARFPTNLRSRNGETVHYPDIFDLVTSASSQRDLPVFQSFHSKNDTGDANYWGPEVIDNYILADASGHGMKLSWSERAHGIDTGPDYNDHWVNGNNPDQQTATDNVVWGEEHYVSNVSYPAFYNNRLDPTAHDPGDGTPGTGPSGAGDDWGTWGGWHRWDVTSITDESNQWSVVAWLESNAVFENDNSPYALLTADLAIRRPQSFRPKSGEMITWKVEDAISGDLLQTGTTFVGDDDLVSITGIQLYREEIRRVRISMTASSVGIKDAHNLNLSSIIIYPNPVAAEIKARIDGIKSGSYRIRIFSMDKKIIREFKIYLNEGLNDIMLPVDSQIPSGVYLLEMISGETFEQVMFVKG